MRTGGVGGTRLPGDDQSLDAWQKLWLEDDKDSLQQKGMVFEGAAFPGFTGSLVNAGEMNPLHFRLKDGSPGKGAGEGGRDLGADRMPSGPA